MAQKVLIVGGVAGGASAAARLRRLDEKAEIVMFERGPDISFANCGLPYYIGGSISDRDRLLVSTPEAMARRFRIDVRTRSEVLSVDPAAKTVRVRENGSREYEERYDALILSPGAKPVRPPLPGVESTRIHTLRNLADTDLIKQRLTVEKVQSAVVIGGGFIGVEMAENLREAGLEVTLVEAGPQILAPFDREMSTVLAKELEQHGVQLLLGGRVAGFREVGAGIETRLEDGQVLRSGLVLLAAGVAPDTAFLAGSGLSVGPRGHILVNNRMETNLANVYAVGDAVEVTDYVNGTQTAIPLAGPANKQGRIAADNVCGLGSAYKGTQGTSIIKVFGLTGAATGNNERTLSRLGIPYHVTYVHPNSHASYYPGALPLSLKLIFDSQGKVLGAQAAGMDGVDKRIDDIATVIRFRGTVEDLSELELAYAPPYSSAKDPVNMAGFTAGNILEGLTRVFLPGELAERDAAATLLVDVRSGLEHAAGSIPSSINIPVDELRDRLAELDREKEIWVYCQVGLRGYTASRILQQLGYRVRNLSGGYKTWLMAQYQPAPLASGNIITGGAAGASAGAGVLAATEVAATGGHARTEAAAALAEPGAEPAAAATGADSPPLPAADEELDACGLCCPGPLLQVKNRMDRMAEGQVLRVLATDPGFEADIRSWAEMSGNHFYQTFRRPDGRIEALLGKGPTGGLSAEAGAPPVAAAAQEGTTMVVFNGDLDRAIATFIIANGAAASGKKVTLFFTFWGLNMIRKPEHVPAAKGFLDRMFGLMLPRGSKKLPLSRMKMLGLGAPMIRKVMKAKQISSLEELMETAVAQGVEMVACQMSMDVMGIKQEELIDGVTLGGVGYYLGKANRSGINLFI
jgi:NADPH-dependent 2,4-dienoyl-CoA reductase/sulfur reductase-like enzyme/peroxiredoxin family protein/rhodanese-related sulfurtransferase/TusA-related sulfurtransferase